MVHSQADIGTYRVWRKCCTVLFGECASFGRKSGEKRWPTQYQRAEVETMEVGEMKSYTIEELEELMLKYLDSGLMSCEQEIAETEVTAFLEFIQDSE